MSIDADKKKFCSKYCENYIPEKFITIIALCVSKHQTCIFCLVLEKPENVLNAFIIKNRRHFTQLSPKEKVKKKRFR